VRGYPRSRRLAAALDIPVAMGETLGSRFEFDAYLRAGAVESCNRISSGSAGSRDGQGGHSGGCRPAAGGAGTT